MSWIKKAYPKVAFYNFEHPEGAGVFMTSDGSTPQVYVLDGRIMIDNYSEAEILDSDDLIKETCSKLWGDPIIAFPEKHMRVFKIPKDLRRDEIAKIIELFCRPDSVSKVQKSIFYKIDHTRVRLSKYGLQIDSKYISLSSKEKIREALVKLLRQKERPVL